MIGFRFGGWSRREGSRWGPSLVFSYERSIRRTAHASRISVISLFQMPIQVLDQVAELPLSPPLQRDPRMVARPLIQNSKFKIQNSANPTPTPPESPSLRRS